MKIVKKYLNAFLLDSFKILFLRLFGVGLQYLVLLFLTNNLTEELFGKYNYLTTIIIPVAAISLLGMDNSFLQFVGKLRAQGQESYLKKLYKNKILITIVMVVGSLILYVALTYIFKDFFSEDRKYIYNYIAITLLPFALFILNIQVLRGLNQLVVSELFRGVFRHGLLLLLILLAISYDKLDDIIVIFSISIYILGVVSTYQVWRSFPKIGNDLINYESISRKQILKTSIPMSISFFSLLIMQSFDIIILERFYDFKVVAHYGIAIKISLIIGIVLASINTLIAPNISSLFYENKKEELNTLVRKATSLNFVITLPIIFFVSFFSEFFLEIFGEEYVVAKSALIIILAGQIFNAICGPVGTYLNMTGRQVVYQKVLLIALLLNLVLNLILIPKFGIIGSAASTSISLMFWNITGMLIIYRKDKINSSIFGKIIIK